MNIIFNIKLSKRVLTKFRRLESFFVCNDFPWCTGVHCTVLHTIYIVVLQQLPNRGVVSFFFSFVYTPQNSDTSRGGYVYTKKIAHLIKHTSP